MNKPYYDKDGITIYCGDCREILPQLDVEVDLVLTDPPYPSYLQEEYKYSDGLLESVVGNLECRQFIFWTPSTPFPLSYSGKRIWDKAVGTNTQFEEIYERNYASGYKIHRYYSMGCFSSVGAQMTKEIVTGHPSQKPLGLICTLIESTNNQDLLDPYILDPFMGSGTTLVAAKKLNRQCIGIEISEKYCEIAVKRLAQEVMDLKV
jgi:tRNA G10  N-methylase Trm11